MKKLLLAFAALLILCLPVMGQDVPAEPTNQVIDVIDGEGEGGTVINVGTPVVDSEELESNVTEFLIGAALLVVVIFSGIVIAVVSQLVPAGIAKELVETGVRAGFQMALDRAETTKSSMDDEIYTALAKIPGLEVTKNADGHYVVKGRTPVSVASTGANFTTTSTHPTNITDVHGTASGAAFPGG